MTSIDTYCTPSGVSEPPPSSTHCKAVLFCPGCGFESEAGENWLVRSNGEFDRFVCPDCDAVVATR